MRLRRLLACSAAAAVLGAAASAAATGTSVDAVEKTRDARVLSETVDLPPAEDPAPAADPAIGVLPDPVSPGEAVVVTGSNWLTDVDSPPGCVLQGDGSVQGLCRIDTKGGLQGSLQIPDDAAAGPYTVTACTPNCEAPTATDFSIVTVQEHAEPLVTVPSIEGQTYDEARRILGSRGLVLLTGPPQDLDATVERQRPPADTEVSPGFGVRATFSVSNERLPSDPEQRNEPPVETPDDPAAPDPTPHGEVPTPRVEVPDLIGLVLADARAVAGASGLEVRVRERPPRHGVVAQQAPRPGTSVSPVARVFVVLQPTSRTIVVPDVTRLSANKAERKVTQAGLGWQARGSDKGVVRRQSPLPGRRLPPGGIVRVLIGPRFADLRDAGALPGWSVPAGIVALLAIITASALAGAAITRRSPPHNTRHGKSWTRQHVRVRSMDGPFTFADLVGSHHTVWLVPHAEAPAVHSEETLQ